MIRSILRDSNIMLQFSLFRGVVFNSKGLYILICKSLRRCIKRMVDKKWFYLQLFAQRWKPIDADISISYPG